MARKSTGKRLRFEVFKRDHFTCQYCGRQPPEVVLVCDHVVPVVEGGETSLDNLMTACEPCNQGKAHRSLTTAGIRPDADLLYLATQQEVAEIRRYQEALAYRQEAVNELIPTLQRLWCDCSGLTWHPSDALLQRALAQYPHDVVGDAIMDVAPKCASGYVNTYDDRKWTNYLFAVCRNMSENA